MGRALSYPLALTLGCAPAGWVDGRPVADLARALATAADGALVEVAAGEHEGPFVTNGRITVRGREGALLTGAGEVRVLDARAPITLEDLALVDGFADEASGLRAPGATLRRVSVRDGRGPSLVRITGDLEASEVELDTPWPAVRLEVAGDAWLGDVVVGPGTEPAALVRGGAITAERLALGDDYWGSVLEGDSVHAVDLEIGAALLVEGGDVVITGVSGPGWVDVVASTAEVSGARVAILTVAGVQTVRVRDVRARGLAAVPADVTDARLTGREPGLAVIDGVARRVVMVSDEGPVRLSLGDARVDGLLVLDHGAEEPAFYAAGESVVSHLTWVGGRRAGLVAGGRLHLDQSVLVDAGFTDLVGVSATDSFAEGVALAPPWPRLAPWTVGEVGLADEGPWLAEGSPLVGLGADGMPGAYGGPWAVTWP